MLKSVALLSLLSAVFTTEAVPEEKVLFTRCKNTCTPATFGVASRDDVPAIHAAIKECGNGGIIKIPGGTTYMIRTMLNISNCMNCEVQIEGRLKVSDDITFWGDKRQVISINKSNNAKVHSVSGLGLVDGNGQAAWDRFAQDSTLKRPILVRIEGGAVNTVISNLSFKNSPSFFLLNEGNSIGTLYESLSISSESESQYPAKNTDGIDIGVSTHTTLRNITISNQDDCVAFKPGANYVTVDGVHCKGSHGISIGSLGKGIGKTDLVQNIYVKNAIMEGATKGVGIKLYPGAPMFGTAVVKNVTFDGFNIKGAEYAAQIQSCYNKDWAYCESNPTTAQITDVVFKNFKGTTGTKYSPVVANINCPAGQTCGVHFDNFDVKSPSGTAQVQCANLPENPGVQCSPGAKG